MADNKIYITARELSDMLGVSMGYAYKIIRKLNKELDKDGFIVIAGKVPKGYFEKRWFQCKGGLIYEGGERQENRKVADSIQIYRLAGCSQKNNKTRFRYKTRG